jgi:hypothetical protein
VGENGKKIFIGYVQKMGYRRKQGAEGGGAAKISIPFDLKPVKYDFKSQKNCTF